MSSMTRRLINHDTCTLILFQMFTEGGLFNYSDGAHASREERTTTPQTETDNVVRVICS